MYIEIWITADAVYIEVHRVDLRQFVQCMMRKWSRGATTWSRILCGSHPLVMTSQKSCATNFPEVIQDASMYIETDALLTQCTSRCTSSTSILTQ